MNAGTERRGMMRMLRVTAVAAAVAVCAVPLPAADSLRATDAFIGDILFSAIAAALEPLREQGIDTLYLRSEAEHTADYLVEDAVYASLKDAVPVIRTADGLEMTDRNSGVKVEAAVTADGGSVIADTVADAGGSAARGTAVRTDAPAAAGPVRATEPEGASSYVLSYRVTDASVRLDHIPRQGFFGPKRLERKGIVACRFRLLRLPGYTITWNGTGEGTGGDIIGADDADATEHGKFAYERVPQERPAWKIAVETVLAGGTVGALMFLFFTQSFN